MAENGTDYVALADWRRRVAELYQHVREASRRDPAAAHADWIETRNTLFRTHACTPLGEEARRSFTGLTHAPYRPEWRVVGRVEWNMGREAVQVDAGQDGVMTLLRVARVAFLCPGGEGELDVFWVAGYGGGLFLPFGDATNGVTTYGGGRYLIDTIKGADLGGGPTDLVLDFNFAYNPSCAYDPRWVCPLAQPGNVLGFEVEVGEGAP